MEFRRVSDGKFSLNDKDRSVHAPVITDKEKCGIGAAGICRRLAQPTTDEVGNALVR